MAQRERILGGVPTESRHPPGLIGVAVSELTRFSSFWISLFSLRVPWGSAIVIFEGPSVAKNCNEMVRAMYELSRAEWLWILGDDHAFEPTILMDLLARNVDIVTPLCYQRKPPFNPVIYRGITEDGQFNPIAPIDLPSSGLIDVAAAGSAGMLVRRRVFDKILDPWFEFGQIQKEHLSEDLYFCRKAVMAGSQIFCDVDQVLGHTAVHTVWPVLEGGQWGTRLQFSPDFNLTLFN